MIYLSNRSFGGADFVVGFTCGYIPEISKNRRYINRNFALNPKHVQAKNLVALACKAKLNGKTLPDGKYYIDIMLYKPRKRIDVNNIVAGVYDAIKDVIGVDDCNFAGHMDFEIDKINPRIEVMIYRSIENDGDKPKTVPV